MKYLFKRRFDCLINSHHQAKIQIRTIRPMELSTAELQIKTRQNTNLKIKRKQKLSDENIRANNTYNARGLWFTTWIKR